MKRETGLGQTGCSGTRVERSCCKPVGWQLQPAPTLVPVLKPVGRNACYVRSGFRTSSGRGDRTFAEVTLHAGSETWLGSPSIRRRAKSDPRACYARSDEAAPKHGQTPLPDDQISHLRTAATSQKSAGGNVLTCVKALIGPRPTTLPASTLTA